MRSSMSLSLSKKKKKLYLIMFYTIPVDKRKVGLSPFLGIEDLALEDLQNLSLLFS